MKKTYSIFWFRRDLRFTDNIGLFHALNNKHSVLPIFIFDKSILSKLPKEDARVSFIFDTVQKMRSYLSREHGSSIAVYYGNPKEIFEKICKEYSINTVFTNHDYEPYAKKRDSEIQTLLRKKGVHFKTFKDQVIFEKNDILKDDGNPYIVYTPYKNKWKTLFNPSLQLQHFPSQTLLDNCVKNNTLKNLSLEEIGFAKSTIIVPEYSITSSLIANYSDTRDYPSIKNGTSLIGANLRFGTISIRKVMQQAIAEENEVFWNELIWREFFMQILWHFPHTVTNSFKPKYDRIPWRNNEQEFNAWKNGKTGYPLVDAGMRQLNTTGYMHNRVRMLVASFLCKHLLIDWRWGEAYFAEKLLDYDLSANIGNWQWAAGSGVDAAPYFRIFNPTTQIQKFDNQNIYIHTWVKDIQELTYPTPIVEHKFARERCLATYKDALR
ncbi:deoxyribodipyrimidine photo-lyase [uncultured Maribacter sp.]|uniref:cryptochrome/photolyase family protein n=1 Tax=uncultured Maribacter sp. TaxID=431308 RepID=UPI002625E899|nr:deoxyribodipyrimidine photo-lyase [uncultured Maribacter sp.]